MTQYDELYKIAKEAVAKVGTLTDDKVKLTKLCQEANKNADDALESANRLMAEAKELIVLLKKTKEERDMYRDLRNIDSHRIGIATQSIDSLEEELRIMQETYEPERKAI